MAIDMANDTLPTSGIIWSGILSVGGLILGVLAKKRDDKLDEHDIALAANLEAVRALELKVAEQYATKVTMLALFDKATQDTKEAVGRVESRLTETNVAVGKQSDNIQNLTQSINNFKLDVMTELKTKT